MLTASNFILCQLPAVSVGELVVVSGGTGDCEDTAAVVKTL